ncbi:MAG: MBL fold metallo-hydrolase [Deltaproteobacteria bacterium]|nr:MBL fold metallo-hydrolase [Deltaproteobacteria bacterium]
MTMAINEVDKIEILTLQDNYVDLISRDNTEMVQRAMPIKDMKVQNSILAEHGFSSMVTITKGDKARSILFDFGFSSHGAALNADALSVDLSTIEAAVLSHGHLDHVGGLAELVERVGRKGIEIVLHPQAFRNPRYLKITEDSRINFPPFTREKVKKTGLKLVETDKPYPLLDGDIFFLGEIPRITDFEKGLPIAYYQEKGEERWDDIADDSSIIANVKGKGLVVLSGCGHSGIVNTVMYAKKISGADKVYAVMGGFHLTGPEMASVIEPTVRGLKQIDPAYIIPTHCTGRDAILKIEKEMPDSFILNMSGTKLTFAA